VESTTRPLKVTNSIKGSVALTAKVTIRGPGLSIVTDGLTVDGSRVPIVSEKDTITWVASNTIVDGLRFRYVYKQTIDGDGAAGPVSRVAFVRCTFECNKDNDIALALWGAVDQISIADSLIYGGGRGIAASHYPEPFQTLARVSIVRNILEGNTERNPQLRGMLRNFELTNNIISGWGDYGTRVRTEKTAVPEVWIRGNLYQATGNAARALIYGEDLGGSDDAGVRVMLSGANTLPPGTDGDRPAPAPPVLEPGAVSVLIPTAGLKAILVKSAGSPTRTAEDLAALARVSGR